jgi:tRNA G18 (ribose-2'-O)-methylase SpoU
MDEENPQQRHKPPTPLDRPRDLVIACPALRSNVNFSRIVRAAGCAGVRRVICCGNSRVIPEIARDTGERLQIEVRRSLPPVLARLRQEGFQLVALEQTANSESIYTFSFARKTVLVIGNERLGVEEEILRMMDHVVEIPVYGLPYAHNVATAGAIALYEYCRQYPYG